jgi:hypothetical protein
MPKMRSGIGIEITMKVWKVPPPFFPGLHPFDTLKWQGMVPNDSGFTQ